MSMHSVSLQSPKFSNQTPPFVSPEFGLFGSLPYGSKSILSMYIYIYVCVYISKI